MKQQVRSIYLPKDVADLWDDHQTKNPGLKLSGVVAWLLRQYFIQHENKTLN